MHMRVSFLFFALMFFVASQAQSFAPVSSFNNYSNNFLFGNHQYDSAHKKLFVTHYVGASAGYIFFKGGGASYLSAPVTLQLNRQLNNHFYAFGNVSVAPTYVNFNQAFLNTNFNKAGINGFNKANNFGFQTSATLGLMYMNDNKTFSISGGITVERNSFPAYNSNQFQSTNYNNQVNHRQ